jgi:hypothetical protein
VLEQRRIVLSQRDAKNNQAERGVSQRQGRPCKRAADRISTRVVSLFLTTASPISDNVSPSGSSAMAALEKQPAAAAENGAQESCGKHECTAKESAVAFPLARCSPLCLPCRWVVSLFVPVGRRLPPTVATGWIARC